MSIDFRILNQNPLPPAQSVIRFESLPEAPARGGFNQPGQVKNAPPRADSLPHEPTAAPVGQAAQSVMGAFFSGVTSFLMPPKLHTFELRYNAAAMIDGLGGEMLRPLLRSAYANRFGHLPPARVEDELLVILAGLTAEAESSPQYAFVTKNDVLPLYAFPREQVLARAKEILLDRVPSSDAGPLGTTSTCGLLEWYALGMGKTDELGRNQTYAASYKALMKGGIEARNIVWDSEQAKQNTLQTWAAIAHGGSIGTYEGLSNPNTARAVAPAVLPDQIADLIAQTSWWRTLALNPVPKDIAGTTLERRVQEGLSRSDFVPTDPSQLSDLDNDARVADYWERYLPLRQTGPLSKLLFALGGLPAFLLPTIMRLGNLAVPAVGDYTTKLAKAYGGNTAFAKTDAAGNLLAGKTTTEHVKLALASTSRDADLNQIANGVRVDSDEEHAERLKGHGFTVAERKEKRPAFETQVASWFSGGVAYARSWFGSAVAYARNWFGSGEQPTTAIASGAPAPARAKKSDRIAFDVKPSALPTPSANTKSSGIQFRVIDKS